MPGLSPSHILTPLRLTEILWSIIILLHRIDNEDAGEETESHILKILISPPQIISGLSEEAKSLSRVRIFATPWTVCSLPGSSIHRLFQARVLEWVAISFSRGSSQPRDRTWVSRPAGRHFTIWATREASSHNFFIDNNQLILKCM